MPAKTAVTLNSIKQERIKKEAAASKNRASTAEFPRIPSGPRSAIIKRQGRSASQPPSSIDGRWSHDLFTHDTTKNTKAAPKINPDLAKSLSKNRLFAAIQGASENNDLGVNIKGSAGPGFSIRGSAGPYAVRGSNFAPGTTANDIKMVMEPMGKILACAILTATPTVIAEIVFDKKEDADRCIQQYNNQKADGNILHLVFVGPPSIKMPVSQKPSQPLHPSRGARRGNRPNETLQPRPEPVDSRVVDGSYGFQAGSGLYSDAMVQRGRGFAKR